MDRDRATRVAELRHTLLELHKAMLDAQRIEYERTHGRIETSGEFLGLVLNHPEFEWIRALSALIAQLDEWAEEMETADEKGLEEIVDALRSLIRPEGSNEVFTEKYWRMVENEPNVTVPHVKTWRLVS
ncbi:MAG TPA: hypothetical protein VM073_12485 [Usitatibacter sp.]|nr:hypothetical protein [Usitatibacter sp.]